MKPKQSTSNSTQPIPFAFKFWRLGGSYNIFMGYYYGGESLDIYPVLPDKDGNHSSIMSAYIDPPAQNCATTALPPFLGQAILDPWDTFYKYAYFEPILADMSGEKNYSEISEEEISKTLTSNIKDDKYLLMLVRDDSFLLNDSKIRSRFINILSTARWAKDKEKRNSAKFLLQDNIIPQHHGGSKPLPAKNLKLGLKLLKRLAKHLSKECKAGLKELTIELEDIYLPGSHDDLERWLSDCNENRLSPYSANKIETLLFKPYTFAEELMLNTLNISKKDIDRM